MIKKLFFSSLMMLGLFTISSCKDDDITSGNNGPVNNENADYTVMFWGVAGRLDEAAAEDFVDLLSYRENGRIGANVNVVGLFKTTVQMTEFGQSSTFKDATISFDLGKKTGCYVPQNNDEFQQAAIGGQEITDLTQYQALIIEYVYDLFVKNTNGKVLGDNSYAFNNVDTLAAFIKRTAATHPAHHYVLMTYGHGDGFNLDTDIRTRACVLDDYTQYSGLSAQDLAEAAEKAGVHFQTLFCHNCLMATLENMPYFQQLADYAVISSEETTNGYFPEYIAQLSAAGDDLEKMKQASRNTIDHYANNKEKLEKAAATTSHGFYDLSQTPALMSVVKKISTWYTDAADKDPVYISKVIDNSLYASDAFHMDAASLQGALELANLPSLLEMRQILLDAYRPEEFEKWDMDKVKKIVRYAGYISQREMTDGFILAHILHQSLALKDETTAKLDFASLQSLNDEYISTLKSMAYIKAVAAEPSIKDYDYIYTSPSVSVVPFNSLYKTPEYSNNRKDEIVQELYSAFHSGDVSKVDELFTKYFIGVSYSSMMERLLQGYSNTLFDQQTGWSSFLKKLPCTPSYFTNPDRSDYVNGLRKYNSQ